MTRKELKTLCEKEIERYESIAQTTHHDISNDEHHANMIRICEEIETVNWDWQAWDKYITVLQIAHQETRKMW